MTEETPERGGELKASTHWVRRTVLIIFCLGLLTAIGAAFTQVIAARVPEQRATLEKLITDRTGLAVRFDNVHFAWGIDGTSAVFERVELTDPARGRVRVVAPELRVEFDTWDFIRHQQFSLGHVTLTSPDIDIFGDPEPQTPPPGRSQTRAAQPVERAEDETALVRRFTAWAELMPVGRVEVEGARVHLYRRGDRAARHDFTLSQAVVSRGSHNFSAFGTMLLSQDIGQSLFVSAKLDGVGGAAVDGELRVIARRVFLDKLPAVFGTVIAARGRGTVDARLSLRAGYIHDGTWQVSARELEMPRGTRFDHFTVRGRLSRANGDFQLAFTDLQLTRGARLERAPNLNARVSLEPGTLRAARVTASAERVPFMAAEFIAGALAPRYEIPLAAEPTEWTPTAGELRNLRFDSRAGTFSAQVAGAEISRSADHARIANLAARLELAGEDARITFDATHAAELRIGDAPTRGLKLAGAVAWRADGNAPDIDFEALRLQIGEAVISADGGWNTDSRQAVTLELSGVDRALLGDAWTLLSLQPLAQLADLQDGRVVSGKLSMLSRDEAGARIVDWQRSHGSLELAGLASAGADVPRLTGAAGKLEFARGGAQLRLSAGAIEGLQITDARLEWPRNGAPRLRASAQGDVRSSLLRRALQEQGLERLTGNVSLDAEARGEAELREPESWRVTARLSNASIPVSDDLPPVEKLAGSVRVSGGELRALALTGSWLGGSVEIESRRPGARGINAANISGVADAAPLLGLLGYPNAAARVGGQLAWNGVLQKREAAGERDGWQLSLTTNLAGVESRLPEPFDKPRARSLAVTAELRFDARGIQDFEIGSGRDAIRGRVREGLTTARFDVQGVTGELRAGVAAQPRVAIDRLDIVRAPAVLAAASAVLPAEGDLVVGVGELRRANRTLGALDATLSRDAQGVEFSLHSAQGSAHELSATGHCAAGERCQMDFTVDTRQLPALLGDTRLPPEWPSQSLHATGELAWQADAGDLTRALNGKFELETQGTDSAHQLMASAVLSDGQIELSNVQGTGPDADQVFHGSGRVGLVARTYDLTIDYEQMSLAASAVPTPARVRLSRAWSSLRGSVARRGWTETAPARRVQWHGSWE